jgi:type II secretory pathway pseudopilin PulG
MFKNIKSKIKTNKGFTFVELIVGVAVFAFIIISVYNAYTGIFNVVYASRAKIEAISIINEQLEIVRNLPYSDVGILSGIPQGKLAHIQTVNRDKYSYVVTTTVRNVDDSFDGTLGGSPNDLSPADFKLVEIDVTCLDCRVNFPEMVVTTRVAPKNLETASTNGALFVKVFDANGNPISDADVHIVNNQVIPSIVIDDVTNASGLLQIVDAPPGVNAYEITVTKSGYSTDQTVVASVGNPNPTKPHATVVLQQVTQISFVIDKLSTFNISSVDEMCSPVGSIDFSLSGSKVIGTPNVLKYSQNKATNSGGLLALSNMEWDIYSFVNIDTAYDLIGINPISPVTLAPNSSQSVQLIVSPKNPRTLLVTVKDGLTGLPLSGVTARLENGGSVNVTKITGQGFMGQTDWSGGGGQATSTDPTMYLSSDGNIENSNPVGDIQLKNILGSYVLSGVITSSSFDTGSASNFQQLFWNPTAQPIQTGTPDIRVQIATNNDGGTWNFAGPDGTAGTYYTVTNQNINSINNGNRYLRYKIFFNTAIDTFTPNISDISFTFTTLCTPPGQVTYQGLPPGDYTVHLSKTGYQSQDININLTSSWQSIEATLISS